MGERGGIVIDNNCRTSDENIFAIGECALWSGRIFGLVAPGYQMAAVAADVIAGVDAPSQFEGADMSTKLKLLGVDVASIGDAHARTEGAQTVTVDDSIGGVYKRLVLDESGKKLIGATLIGDAEEYGMLLQMMQNGLDLPGEPIAMISPSDGEKPSLGADALPDEAMICSCHNVSKGDLVSAIADGNHVPELKSCTKSWYRLRWLCCAV